MKYVNMSNKKCKLTYVLTLNKDLPQGINESRIRLAVYRAVDAALDNYSKTVEEVAFNIELAATYIPEREKVRHRGISDESRARAL